MIAIAPSLAEHHKRNFETLQRAWTNESIALVSAIRVADQQPVALVCAIQQNGDNTLTPVPLAEMVNGNPFELYQDPTI